MGYKSDDNELFLAFFFAHQLTGVSHYREVRPKWYSPEYDPNIWETFGIFGRTIAPNTSRIFGDIFSQISQGTSLPDTSNTFCKFEYPNIVNIPEHPEDDMNIIRKIFDRH